MSRLGREQMRKKCACWLGMYKWGVQERSSNYHPGEDKRVIEVMIMP